jgi:multicomponent Na+:H+ antiporter subunit C
VTLVDLFLDRYVYLLVLALLAIGLYGMLAIGNLARKLIGMVVFSTAIYLFFIHGSLQEGATAPIIDPELGSDPTAYVDPLPHLLILTAIVVGVGVLGVGLALLVRLYRAHGTLDEAVIADRLSGGPSRSVPRAAGRTGATPTPRESLQAELDRDVDPGHPRGTDRRGG